MVVGIPDVITYANFGEDRLRGLGVAGGQNLPFCIDFDRRLYNTTVRVCDAVNYLWCFEAWFANGVFFVRKCFFVDVFFCIQFSACFWQSEVTPVRSLV